MNNYLKEQGYEVKEYFSGKPVKTFNLHFRGEFIGAFETLQDAQIKAIFHDDERSCQIL